MSIRATLAAESRAAAIRARSRAHDALRGRNMSEFRFWISIALGCWRSFQSLRVRAV